MRVGTLCRTWRVHVRQRTTRYHCVLLAHPGNLRVAELLCVLLRQLAAYALCFLSRLLVVRACSRTTAGDTRSVVAVIVRVRSDGDGDMHAVHVSSWLVRLGAEVCPDDP